MARRVRMFLIVLLASLSVFGQVRNSEVVEDVTSSEPWVSAPSGFRDVPFGATVEEATAVLGPMKCKTEAASQYQLLHQRCSTKDPAKAFKVSGKPVYTYYLFYQDRFVGAQISGFVQQDYYGTPTLELTKALTAKFGEPTRKVTVRYWGTKEVKIDRYLGGRRAGSRIDFVPYDEKRTTLQWTNESVFVEVDQYGVEITTQEWQAARKDLLLQREKSTDVSPF